MKTYRCKHAVEALRWTDTEADREEFFVWFDAHGVMFETRGDEIVLPEQGTVAVGDWVLYSDGEFLALDDEAFRDTYEETAP